MYSKTSLPKSSTMFQDFRDLNFELFIYRMTLISLGFLINSDLANMGSLEGSSQDLLEETTRTTVLWWGPGGWSLWLPKQHWTSLPKP